MMTSSNGNIFRVTGHLCGEFTGPGEFPAQRPVTRSLDVLFDLRLNKQLSNQSWGWWFEMLSRPLWRQCNVANLTRYHPYYTTIKCLFLGLRENRIIDDNLLFPYFKNIHRQEKMEYSTCAATDNELSTVKKNLPSDNDVWHFSIDQLLSEILKCSLSYWIIEDWLYSHNSFSLRTALDYQ